MAADGHGTACGGKCADGGPTLYYHNRVRLTTMKTDANIRVFKVDGARHLFVPSLVSRSLEARIAELEASTPLPPNMKLIQCDQVGCMNGEFAYPSSKGWCPKCSGTGKLLRLK